MKKQERVLIIVVLVVMVLAIVGVSYAVFNYSALGTKVNSITTGAITMTYVESSNTISLNGALPTTDKTGKALSDYFEFTVSSSISGDVNINYEISAKRESGTLEDRYIKLYLTRVTASGEEELMTPETYNEETSSNTYTGRPANEMSLYTSSMNSSESNTYRLRMYVDESYNPQGDGGGKTFSVKVNVYGRDRAAEEVSTVLLNNIPEAMLYDDGVDTFIRGSNDYIWYSGKLWRAVSINNDTKTTKLITQGDISAVDYDGDSSAFEGSYIEEWLNDTSVDGFLGNLREPEKFIKMDSVWNATETAETTKPPETTMVTAPVGLLNVYEYVSTMFKLFNQTFWFTLTPESSSGVYYVSPNGNVSYDGLLFALGVRPCINLKSDVKIVDGDGTIDNPYRLEGDNDTNLSGTFLNTRYSGEYIRFGSGENNLYRIVSHENGIGTKITSAEPLKENGKFKMIPFGDNSTFSSNNTIGTFLNGEYLTNYVGDTYSNMIEDSTTWYLGTVEDGTSYKLAKYKDANMSEYAPSTKSKVGLLRYGELMAGQDSENEFGNRCAGYRYWTLTPYDSSNVMGIDCSGLASHINSDSERIRPALNLKSNVIITGGNGTKNSPFTLSLAS